MDNLAKNIQAYETMQEELEREQRGKWVLFYNTKLIKLYDSFEDAAADAVLTYGAGPYLIRQIGAPPLTLPASVLYNVRYGDR